MPHSEFFNASACKRRRCYAATPCFASAMSSGRYSKVHAVDVEPFGAPDETVALEDLADGAWNAIAPDELCRVRPFRFSQ